MILPSPVGPLEIVSDGTAITQISFATKKTKSTGRETKHLGLLAKELAEYFAGKRTTFSVPLNAEGTPFQQSVWRAMSKIPYGQTLSYGEIAKKIGKPNALRAVGTACGKNPIVIVLPCHRVTAASGGIGGYSGGLPKKKILLALERNATSKK